MSISTVITIFIIVVCRQHHYEIQHPFIFTATLTTATVKEEKEEGKARVRQEWTSFEYR